MNVDTSEVRIEKYDDRWVISGLETVITLKIHDLSVGLDRKQTAWRMLPAGPDDLVIRQGNGDFPVSLTFADNLSITPYRTGSADGVKVELDGLRGDGREFDVKVALYILLESATQELVCRVVVYEKQDRVRQVHWPKPFAPKDIDRTAFPLRQGALFPRNWPQKMIPLHYTHSLGMYMPWWGHEQGSSAVIAIIETSDDAGVYTDHPPGGPTRMGVQWRHSMGQFKDSRSIRFAFLDRGNYVAMTKRYRRYAKDTGLFVSLETKIARTPALAKLIGCPVVHEGIVYNTQPCSPYYNHNDPASNRKLSTFDQRADQLRLLQARGFEKIYLHLDGWGKLGYDRMHPDLLPPNVEAGGWDGLRRLCEACGQLGYLLVLHDQYHDLYLESPSYQPYLAEFDESGQRFEHSTWNAVTSFLAPDLAPGFLRRNHTALAERGIRLAGTYLDVFACVGPRENYNLDHPLNRSGCMKYWGRCFDMIRAQWGIVSSEEPCDWTIPHLDLVHHAPHHTEAVPGKEMDSSGPAAGIPVPLFDLVYHDAIFTPWTMARGIWGVPENEDGMLYALLHGGLPYMGIEPDTREVERVQTVCRLHERLALQEMINHEFLDASHRRQKTTFSDGTTVSIDLDRDAFEIRPAGQEIL